MSATSCRSAVLSQVGCFRQVIGSSLIFLLRHVMWGCSSALLWSFVTRLTGSLWYLYCYSWVIRPNMVGWCNWIMQWKEAATLHSDKLMLLNVWKHTYAP